MLPEIGASIALAYAALESFSHWLLDNLASVKSLPNGLWEWINKRPQWDQEPSVEERFDKLLKILTGSSLKDEQELWQTFLNLRKARNSFSHTGVAVTLQHKPLTEEMAIELVNKARDIVDWCERLLPEPVRRPRTTASVEFFLRKNVLNPDALNVPDEPSS
jgi:hypothetical protein